jgi:hypothetical protein
MSVARTRVVVVAFDGAPVESIAESTPRRRGWFARFMLALKISRQHAAARELRRCEHLIDLERSFEISKDGLS